MICSFTNCWYPGTLEVIYPDYSTVQLLYLWDKKVQLSITNAIKCPSLTAIFLDNEKKHSKLSIIVWEMSLDTFWDKFTYKNKFRHQKLFLGPQCCCWKWNFFDWFLEANSSKNTKINLSSKSVKIKEHKLSNICENYDF